MPAWAKAEASAHLDTLMFDLGVSWADGVGPVGVIGLELVKRHVLVADKVHEGVLP